MLLTLSPAMVSAFNPDRVPSWLIPLFDGPKRGVPLRDTVQEIVTSLGFTSLVYVLTTAAHRVDDKQLACWTTASPDWITEYERKSYIEVDPCMRHGWDQGMPLIWDSRIGAGNRRVQQFLARAAFHGIGSGAVVFLREARRSRIMIALNSPERELSDIRIAQMANALGDYILFGTTFHALYVRGAIDNGLPAGRALSRREKQCLNLASKGQTSSDVAFKLGITERTANFHFSNAMTKLDAINRVEAIAKACALGVIGE